MPKTQDEIERVILENTKAEYDIDVQNHTRDNEDFELYMSIYNLVPDQPEEPWMSNTPLPEFLTEMTVQSGLEAAQEFRRRDFVEIFHESKDDKHRLAGEAKKELINRVLNQRHIHYFQKRMRASGLKNISGKVYFRCKWERKTIKKMNIENQAIPLENPIEGGQQQAIMPVEVETEEVIYDRFNLDVLDPRNVTTSPEITYSLDDKKRVSVRYDTDIGEMTDQQELMGYINLDKVRKALESEGGGQTDVAKGDDEGDIKPQEYQWTALKTFEAVEISLKEWVLVAKDGLSIKPGIDIQGNPVKNAVLMMIIKTLVTINEKDILVRYQRYPFRTPFGEPYRDIVIGKCYIHPTNDLGLGDGKASYPLEIARNGLFNMGVNRVNIATLPTLIAGTASAQEFRRTWAFQPRGIFEAYDTNDVKEMQISDDITGVNQLMSVLTSAQQASNASFPTAQGGLPLASTSATATAASEARTDARQFYKGLTYNNTALMPIYDRIGWMYWQFALPETAEKGMGDKIFDFNPYLDHTFKTVTEALETESSKQAKIAILDNMFAQSAQVQNKNTLKQLNYIFTKKAKLLGDEYEDVNDMLFDEDEEFVASGAQGSLPAPGGAGATNQTGQAINPIEAQVRQVGRQN